MHLFVSKMADPDISDYECDADDLLLMPIIIPQFDLQAEFQDLDSENSEEEETGYVQSKQEGRRLLPLRLPDFAIQYQFQ
jgi:hypothetical protein